MKRVLIISYYWPPSGGSGVQRWVKFSKYFPNESWQPVIYTPDNPELIARDEKLGEEIPKEVEVIKKRIIEPYNLYRKLFRKGKKGENKAEVNPINQQNKSFLQKVSMFIRGNFFIPDPRFLWIKPSVKYLKSYLKDHPVDIIISTGPPHSMHLIAMKLAKATGLPWIADFRDPWTKLFYFKHLNLSCWAEKKHKSLELSVLNSATRVVAVSPLVQEEFQKMTKTPVELITNGYDEDDFEDDNGGAENDNDAPKIDIEAASSFNITHTGLFASDGNPYLLWEVLAEKCSEDEEFKRMLRIRLVGKTDSEIIAAIEENGLDENLVDRGYQPHIEAVKEQKGASLLLLPLRKEPEYKAVLPGKLFEYLAAKKPILGIGQSDGAMARILEETESGVVYDWSNKIKIKSYIDNAWTLFKDGKFEINPNGLEKYSRRNTTKQMVELMNKII